MEKDQELSDKIQLFYDKLTRRVSEFGWLHYSENSCSRDSLLEAIDVLVEYAHFFKDFLPDKDK